MKLKINPPTLLTEKKEARIGSTLFKVKWEVPSQMFYKIGVPKNFTELSGKHLCWSHFLMQLQA